MIPAFIDKTKIPHHPGVYIYKDSSNQVLYVGKAIDLNSRVSSYFTGTQNSKTAALVERIVDIETIIVESELEALLLEANLIKKYLPPFNIMLTDDKDYLYIAVTDESFPKIITARKKKLSKMKKYWGPFPSARTVKNTLKSLRRVFPWCANPVVLRSKAFPGRLKRPCFYYHLELCPGVCAGLISQTDYNKIINRFAKFMDGKKQELIKELTAEMTQFAQRQDFEKAGQVKKTLEGIAYLTQSNRVKLYLENPNFLKEETKIALRKLQDDLRLAKLPERIEGYDISNILGKEATGSMVVLTNGEIDKSEYRKFKIRTSGKPNDVGMHKEILRRRLKHKDWSMPDLILIDGGRGQAKAAKAELGYANYTLPVFGLAKRMEWLYPPEGTVLKLPKNSPSLKLLRKLRDEAHRFAIKYHRKLRDKDLLRS